MQLLCGLSFFQHSEFEADGLVVNSLDFTWTAWFSMLNFRKAVNYNLISCEDLSVRLAAQLANAADRTRSAPKKRVLH